jgi:uncharacterized membrane protein
VTAIAYAAKPPLPGWMQTAGALLVGWIFAGVATLALYVAAAGLGAIANGYAYPGATPNDWTYGVKRVSLSDWPYPDSGLWTLFANVAVVALVLLLTTVATALWLRRSYEHFSEGRLALVLLLTGWLPLAGGPAGGLFGFLFAVLLVRAWVTRAQDRLPVRTTIITVAVLALVAATYGLLHPFWTMDVEPWRANTAFVVINNAAQVPVRVDGFTVSPAAPLFRQADGFKLTPRGAAQDAFRFAPRSDLYLIQPLPQGCGTLRLGIHVRYHIFGLPLTQTVPAFAKLGGEC